MGKIGEQLLMNGKTPSDLAVFDFRVAKDRLEEWQAVDWRKKNWLVMHTREFYCDVMFCIGGRMMLWSPNSGSLNQACNWVEEVALLDFVLRIEACLEDAASLGPQEYWAESNGPVIVRLEGSHYFLKPVENGPEVRISSSKIWYAFKQFKFRVTEYFVQNVPSIVKHENWRTNYGGIDRSR